MCTCTPNDVSPAAASSSNITALCAKLPPAPPYSSGMSAQQHAQRASLGPQFAVDVLLPGETLLMRGDLGLDEPAQRVAVDLEVR